MNPTKIQDIPDPDAISSGVFAFLTGKSQEFKDQKKQAEDALQQLYAERDAVALQKEKDVNEAKAKQGELAAQERKTNEAIAEQRRLIAANNGLAQELARLRTENDQREAAIKAREDDFAKHVATTKAHWEDADRKLTEWNKLREKYHSRIERLKAFIAEIEADTARVR